MENLKAKAKWIRQQVFEMIVRAKRGHIGGSFSCVEMMVALYYGLEGENDIILSKGHAAPVLYAILADKGLIPMEELQTFCQLGSRLEGHPSRPLPGVLMTSGSLGNGLGVGAGLALAQKMDGSKKNVYVVMSDGEFDEGATWEAVDYAGRERLSNLVAVVDCNMWSVLRRTASAEYLRQRLIASRWQTLSALNGHNPDDLIRALSLMRSDRPKALLCETTKGKGISFMENRLEWHGGIPSEQEIEQARNELYANS